MTRIAVLQMNSGIDPEANFAAIERAAHEARKDGALALFTPEMSALLDQDRRRASRWIDSDGPQVMVDRLARLAQDAGLDLAIGSIPVPSETQGKWANRSFYFSHSGRERSQYDKLHLFEASLADGESWKESSSYAAGNRLVIREDTPVGRLGLTICYDLRFAALFEQLGKRRCDAIAVPAAFTRPTGMAHWHVLMRARAIEATAFVIAAAQVGEHEDGRKTYGHSLVVDPWGEVLLDLGGSEPSLGICEIDLGRIAEVRAQMPSLANKRDIPDLETHDG